MQLSSILGLIAKAIKEASKVTEYHVLCDYQKKTVEAYLSGRDVFVSASTGVGRSLTFEQLHHLGGGSAYFRNERSGLLPVIHENYCAF